MMELFTNTFSDPAIFWAAVEAVATTVALTFIYLEFRSLKREKSQFSFEGFKYVIDLIYSDTLKSNIEFVEKEVQVGNWDTEPVHKAVYAILKDLNTVAFMIEEKFLDEEMFLSQFKSRIVTISRALTRIPVDSIDMLFANEIKQFPKGFELIEIVLDVVISKGRILSRSLFNNPLKFLFRKTPR